MPFALPIHATPYTDYAARVSIAEGYNTNTYQAQDDPKVRVIKRHPSPFTGVDGQLEMRVSANPTDTHIIRFGGRFNHYEPLTKQDQSDDGALTASYTGRFTLTPRTFVNASADASLTTLNGAHLADTTFFEFDPTLVRRTYWLSTEEIGITHEISSTLRIAQSAGVIISGTVYQPPTFQLDRNNQLQQVQHRGLDFASPYLETDLAKDFSERTTGDLMLRLSYSYNLYVLDLTQRPPVNIGPDKFASATALVGHTYRFSPELSNSIHVGGSVATAPPRDIDQRPILSPAVQEELAYTREFWQFLLAGGYSYGSANPRLGAGPSLSGSATLTGTPYRVGHWRDFSVLAAAQAGTSTLLTGVGQSTTLNSTFADAEVRYALNPWLGLLVGYQIRYATFSGPQFNPPFLQHVIFIGLAGYWSTDRNIPALSTFVAPIAPPS